MIRGNRRPPLHVVTKASRSFILDMILMSYVLAWNYTQEKPFVLKLLSSSNELSLAPAHKMCLHIIGTFQWHICSHRGDCHRIGDVKNFHLSVWKWRFLLILFSCWTLQAKAFCGRQDDVITVIAYIFQPLEWDILWHIFHYF